MTARTSRRAILGGGTALATLGTAAGIAMSCPDADLIALCAGHAEKVRAVQEDAGEIGTAPAWDAYFASVDAIGAARPTTMAGMLAKMRAAKVEAMQVDGSECPENTPAAGWAWQVADILLRLHGGAA